MVRCRLLRVFAVMLLVALVGAACATSGKPQQQEKVLRIAIRPGVMHLNPEGSVTRYIFEVTQYCYEQLMTWTSEGKLEPRLAERVEVSPDGLEYTFHLRKGVKFHDGAPWNAQAAKANLDRKLANDVPYASFIKANISEILAPEEHVLKIRLKQPADDLLGVLAAYPMCMVSPQAVASHDSRWFETNMVGTGPFILEEWKRGEYVKLKKNPEHYLADKIKADRIVLLEITEASTRAAMVESGEVDAAIEPPITDVERLSKKADAAGVKVDVKRAMGVTYVVIHCQKPPTNDLLVRQALNYAVDKDAMMKVVFRGLANVPASGQIISRLAYPPSWPDKLGEYPYDKAKAAELLDKAGWKLGQDGWRYKNGQKMELLMRVDIRDSSNIDIAQMVQQYLRDVGIAVRTEIIDPGSMHAEIFKKAEDQRHHLFTFGFGIYTGAVEYAMNAGPFHTNAWPYRPDGKEGYYNFCYYSNPEVDRLIDQGNATTGEARYRLYLQAAQIVQQEPPTIQLWEQVGFLVRRADIEGIGFDPVVRVYPAYFASKAGWK